MHNQALEFNNKINIKKVCTIETSTHISNNYITINNKFNYFMMLSELWMGIVSTVLKALWALFLFLFHNQVPTIRDRHSRISIYLTLHYFTATFRSTIKSKRLVDLLVFFALPGRFLVSLFFLFRIFTYMPPKNCYLYA